MYKVIKRLFDFICALIALIILSPLFLLTAIGILISDWGPIFYKANRIGKGNKPFKMYKFRSMKVLKAPKKGSEASLRPDEDRIFPFGLQCQLLAQGLWLRISLICSVMVSGMKLRRFLLA